MGQELVESEQMKTIERNISELIGAEYNPRRISKKQMQDLKDSINRFGFVEPVLVNMHSERENIIISGHQRTTAAREMGIDKVPCVELSLDLDKERELNVRMNKSGGEFDAEILEEFFDKSELIEWGFESSFFDNEESNMPEDIDVGEIGYRVEIECISESEQEALFNKLTKEGYTCKILTL